MLALLRRLELGLLTVAMDSELHTVETVLYPGTYAGRKNRKKTDLVLGELTKRNCMGTQGGVNRRKIMTVYREKTIELACLLEERQEISTKELATLGYDKGTVSILQRNYSRWFVRVRKGMYALSELGRAALREEEFADVVLFYRNRGRRKQEKDSAD